ncbi:carbon storage regulator [Vibrio sp. NTOU-M3]|uniref:carbon storage regulator n=1 Tax=unclassified Vibrio TaxID=2614977 RepID=UPI00349F0DB9
MRLALFVLGLLIPTFAYADDLVLTDFELSETELDSSRGGQYYIDLDSIAATSTVEGISSGNVAEHVVTGNNTIAAGALAASSGITNVIQNSGNNVLIQNSTVVNLTLK